jgi:hypothetical protein
VSAGHTTRLFIEDESSESRRSYCEFLPLGSAPSTHGRGGREGEEEIFEISKSLLRLLLQDAVNYMGYVCGKPEGKRPFGRLKRRWEDNIRLDLREIEWGGVEWLHLGEDNDRWRTVVNTVMNLRVQ